MADAMPTPTDEQGRPAKFRLTQMLTVAVGLVDRAANERTFLVVKRNSGMDTNGTQATTKDQGTAPVTNADPAAPPPAAPAAPPDAPAADAIKLPAAAKQALTDGLTAIFQKLAPIAELIQSAAVDEAAAVPPELCAALDEGADALDMLADQFAPTTAMDMAAPPAPAPAAAPAPAPGATTEPAAKDETGAPAPAADAVAKSAEPTTPVQKAGRRIAKARLEQLQAAHDLHGKAHELMGSIVKDLSSGTAPKAKPPAPGATPAPAAEPTTKDVGEAVTKAVEGAVEKALEPLLAPLGSLVETLKSSAATTALERMRKAVGTGNAAPNDGPPPPPPAPKAVAWPLDLAAEVAAEQKQKSGAQSGARR